MHARDASADVDIRTGTASAGSLSQWQFLGRNLRQNFLVIAVISFIGYVQLSFEHIFYLRCMRGIGCIACNLSENTYQTIDEIFIFHMISLGFRYLIM